MQTLGPFLPSQVENDGGSPSWDIANNQGSVNIPFDQASGFLKVTHFKDVSGNPISLPNDKTVVEGRLSMPDMVQGGKLFNNSSQEIVGPNPQDAWAAPPVIRVESDSTPGLTPVLMNDPTFGFRFSIYNGGVAGLFFSGQMAMYIDVA